MVSLVLQPGKNAENYQKVLEDKSHDQHFSVRMLRLTPEAIIDLKRSLEEIEFEFLARSRRETLTKSDKVKLVRFISGCREGSFVN